MSLERRTPDLTASAGPTETLPDQLRSLLERLASHGMTSVAIGAFAIGLFLHVCVVYAVLDDGGTGSVANSGDQIIAAQPAAAVTTATPGAGSDRTSCDQIRGTDYRSETERLWFQRNCS